MQSNFECQTMNLQNVRLLVLINFTIDNNSSLSYYFFYNLSDFDELTKDFLLQCNMFLSCSAPCKTFRRYKFNIFQKTIYFCHVTFAWYGSYWPIWFQLKLIVLDTYQIKTQTPNQAFKALKLCAVSPTNSGLE